MALLWVALIVVCALSLLHFGSGGGVSGGSAHYNLGRQERGACKDTLSIQGIQSGQINTVNLHFG